MTRVTLQLHSAKVLIVMIIIFFMVVFLSFDAAKIARKNEPAKKAGSPDKQKSILLHGVVSEPPPIVYWKPIAFPRTGVKIACANAVSDLLCDPSSVEMFEFR